MAESAEELKSLLMRVKEESEKAGLKFNIEKTKIMASGLITSCQIDGRKKWKQWQILYCLAPKSLQTVTVGMKLKDVAPWKKSYGKPRRHLKKQRHRFAGKDPYSQSCVFSSNYMQMSELDHKEG